MQQEQNSALPQSLKNKFISIRSRSQSKLEKLQSLKSSRNLNYVSNEKQWSTQKIQQRTPQLGQFLKPQIHQKPSLQKEVYNLQMVQQSIKLHQLLKKLRASFIHNKIPQFYTYYFYKRIKDLRQQSFSDTISREVNWLKEKKSHFQLIEPIIKAREGCLRQLQKGLDNLFKNPQDQGSFSLFKQEIKNYRKITTLVINQIKLWKDYLNGLCERQCQQNPVFLYKNEDYFVTLMNDNMFIFNSFLSTYLNFTDKNDPFILKPTVDKSKSQKYFQLFSCTQEERNQYIVLINYLAEQRAKQLFKKVSTNDDRVRDIERIYRSTKNNTDDLKAQLIMINSEMKRSKTYDLQSEKRLKQMMKKVNDNKNDSRIGSQEKQYMSETERKSQAMKRIRQMVSSKNGFSSIINKNKIIDGLKQQQDLKKQPDTIISPLRMKLSKIDYDDDFIKMMRKKQIQVLEQAKQMKQIKWKLRKGQSMKDTDRLLRMNGNSSNSTLGRSGSFKTIRISGSLSKERRLLNNQSCMNQLQAIVSQFDSRKNIGNNLLGLSRSRAISTKSIQAENKAQNNIDSKTNKQNLKNSQKQKKTLIEKNEDVILEMKNAVLKEIQEQERHQQQYLTLKKQENQKMQKILHNKIELQVLKQTNKFQKDVRNFQQEQNFNNSLTQTQLQKEIQQKLDKQRQNLKIGEQLRKQFQQKLLRQVYNDLKNSSQYKQLDNQQKRILQKQQKQKRYKQIQRQQRAKLMKIMVELNLKKKKQIEKQMQRVINEEKEKMEKLSHETKIKLEHELKQQAKSRLLAQLKSENQQYEREKLTQIEIKLKEQKYRQQVKRKLTKQYKLQEIVERQRQKQQKEKKLKMIEQKFQEYDKAVNKSKKNNEQSSIYGIDNNSIQKGQNSQIQTHLKTLTISQARERILQQDSPQKKSQHDEKYRKLQQSQKFKLREQFQVELFAFMKPQKYTKKQTDSEIAIKDIQSIVGDVEGLTKKQQALKKQIEEIRIEENSFKKKQKPIDQNEFQKQKDNIFKKQQTQTQRFERFSSVSNSLKDGTKQQKILQKNNSFFKKSQIPLSLEEQKLRMKLGMTVQQYGIYVKKKALINKNIKVTQKQVSKNNSTIKKQQQKGHGQFELLDFSKYPQQIGQSQIVNDQIDQSHALKSSFAERYGFDEINQKQHFDNTQRNKLNQMPSKKEINRSKNEQMARLSVRNSHKMRQTKNKSDKFMTSGSDDEEQSIRINIKSPYDQIQRNRSQNKKAYQQRQQQKSFKKNKPIVIQQEQQSFLQLPTPKKHDSQPPFIKTRHIKSSKLQQFMKDHFEHMPKLIKRLNLYKRDELVKTLRQDYSSFTILEYIENDMSHGIVVVVENKNKKNIRSFNIIHLGPYDENDTLKLLVKSSQHIFTHDPLQQITLSIFYHTDDYQQTKFIKQFEKQFDPYGSIFQKKIYDTKYERKFVMRRMIGMKQIKYKEKVNCGSFWVRNQLIVMEKSLGSQRYELQDAGINCGSYGIVGMYLAQKLSQEKLIKILALQNTLPNKEKTHNNVTNTKYLAKQSLSFKQDIQKLCSQKQYHQQSFPNALEFNLNRNQQKKTLVKCLPQYHQQPIECIQLSIGLQLQSTYPFTIQSAKFMFDDDQYTAEYFRFAIDKKSKQKTYSVKSSLFSSVLTFMPCKNSRYKLFVLSSQEYDGVVRNSNKQVPSQEKKNNNVPQVTKDINLDVYIKLFFANLQSHEISTYESIWLPQFKSIQQYRCKEIQQSFIPESRSILSSQLQFYYTNYLQNSLVYEPSHRDLFITSPFILGVIDSQMQLVAEGSTLVAKRIQLEDLIGLKKVAKIIDED